jgi:hypothetical protein
VHFNGIWHRTRLRAANGDRKARPEAVVCQLHGARILDGHTSTRCRKYSRDASNQQPAWWLRTFSTLAAVDGEVFVVMVRER